MVDDVVAVVEGLLVLKVVDAVVRQPVVARVRPPGRHTQEVESRAKAKSNQEGSPALGHLRIDEDVLRPVPEPEQHIHTNRQQQKEKDSAPAQTAEAGAGWRRRT